MSVQDKVYR